MPPKIPLTLNSFRFNMLIDCSENGFCLRGRARMPVSSFG